MTRLTIHHKTEYTYANPVAFGEHRIMLRPRDGHDLRVMSKRITITPEPLELRWIHDVFGNSVGIATFTARADKLVFESEIEIDHTPRAGLELAPDDDAYYYPFAYSEDEWPDLARSIERRHSDPHDLVEKWARQFLAPAERTRTQDLLIGMTRAVREQLNYHHRYEAGVQEPAHTLRLRSGTCRDFALLMIEALRSLGLAARFVSGYLRLGPDENGRVGGGSTHAWVQVYLPSLGWVDFDPTNGIVGSEDLVRVAVASEPRQAIPLWGTYYGNARDWLDMRVEIEVRDVCNAA